MILTDDNFATIVKAVEYGRAIYDNLAKYIRFQMGMLSAFIISYLGATIFGILGGVPFSTLVVLWINFLVQIPIAMALGFDKPSPGLMERKPRPLSQPVLSRSQWVRLVFTGLLIAIGTLVIEAILRSRSAHLWQPPWGSWSFRCSTSPWASALVLKPARCSTGTTCPTGASCSSTGCRFCSSCCL